MESTQGNFSASQIPGARLLNVHEVSDYLRLALPTIRKLVCSRKIPFIRLGRRVLFDETRLAEWVRERTVEPVSGDVPARRGRPRKAEAGAGGAA